MPNNNITPCLFALILTLNLSLHLSSASDEIYKSCTGEVTTNNIYDSNLDTLSSSLSTEAVAKQGFHEITIGTAPDQISGLVLCRGDTNFHVCGSCINQIFADLSTLCQYSGEVTIYCEFCLLSYSNGQFLKSLINSDKQPIMSHVRFKGWDRLNYTGIKFFKTVVYTLLSSVSDQVAYNSTKRFGTGVINITGSLPIPMMYGLSQCTPVISINSCRACLEDLIDQMLNIFDGRQGGRYLGVRCNLRYEIYRFFANPDIQISSISGRVIPTPLPPRSDQGSPEFSSGGKSRHLIIIISISVALLIIGCFISLLLIRKISQEEEMLAREPSADSPLFDFNQIANATGNFALDNKLGQGGFGPVYKGILQDGLEIAVKRLSTHSGQGLVEFNNEIQLIAKLQHRNLVRLIGWCIQGEEKILIYEFMPNKSLDYFIFDKTRAALLNWERRFEIIEGIGQGLLYLHKHSRLRIVHRDLKASNVLLDSEMNPKISDFGLARIFGPNELQANTNRVVGTYGYMAPEYASDGLFSMKSDVFSFGVLLLEIVSGKRNIGFHQYEDFLNLLGYAWVRWKDGSFSELICPTLTQVSQTQRQIERCIHVALLCVEENPVDRPIMSDVIIFLTTETIILPEPKQPAYSNVRVTEEAVGSYSINYLTLTNPEVR